VIGKKMMAKIKDRIYDERISGVWRTPSNKNLIKIKKINLVLLPIF
jgi:hypothetical protein